MGNDIFEGKRTLMLAHLLRTVTGPDQSQLSDILAKNRYQKTQEEVDWVISKMDQLGSFDYADRIMRQFGHQAHDFFLKHLDFLSNKPACDYLDYLPEFLVNRDH